MEYEVFLGKICAGIVLYEPDLGKLCRNIEALLPQVDKILLVDNASHNIGEVEAAVNGYPDKDKIEIIRNSENRGIAAGLNQILAFAEERGYEWYLSMDQDSCCSENLIKEYHKALQEEDAAILTPYILNNGKETIEEYQQKSLPFTERISQPVDCITSACLNQVSAVKAVGAYDEKLFIDCVDVDLNIRLMKAGYQILRVNTAYLVQYMGEGKPVKAFIALYKLTGKNIFKRLRYTPVYGNFRLYYIARNSRYMFLKYGEAAGRRMSKNWMRFQFVYYFLTYPLKTNRIAMVKTIRKGIADAKRMEL